jgi:hypothetical protein
MIAKKTVHGTVRTLSGRPDKCQYSLDKAGVKVLSAS